MQSELLIRTQPTIYDVLIAFFGGFAGIMATASKQKGNVIPGVAIATALMPPLCTAGYGLSEMNTTYLFGAFFLYIINTVFIGMATFLACRLLKLPARQTEPSSIKKAQRIGVGIALFTFLPALYLGVSLYQETRFKNNAESYIGEACFLEDNYLFSSNIDYKNKTIELVYGGAAIPDSLHQLIVAKKDDYDLEGTTVNIIESFSKPITKINEGLKKMHHKMDEKDIKIQQLTAQFDSLRLLFSVTDTENRLLLEFPNLKRARIVKTGSDYKVNIDLKEPKQRRRRRTVPISINSEDSAKITHFVSQRLGTNNVILNVLEQ